MPLAVRVLVVVMSFLLAGCRPSEPLDWKVSAPNPRRYHAWLERTMPQLSGELQAEYGRAFAFIAAKSPGRATVRHMLEEHNPLCRHLHNRTIRDVILEGYRVETQSLLDRISAETNFMLTNARRRDEIVEPKTEARFDEVQETPSARIARAEKRLREIERRREQLERIPAS